MWFKLLLFLLLFFAVDIAAVLGAAVAAAVFEVVAAVTVRLLCCQRSSVTDMRRQACEAYRRKV